MKLVMYSNFGGGDGAPIVHIHTRPQLDFPPEIPRNIRTLGISHTHTKKNVQFFERRSFSFVPRQGKAGEEPLWEAELECEEVASGRNSPWLGTGCRR